jgi:gliding motility-associated-like protein
MESKFSPRVKEVISYSREEALRLGQDFIGIEHILLGLIRDGEGLGLRVMKSLDVDLVTLRKTVEANIKDKVTRPVFVANQNKTYTVTGMDQYGCVGQATINVTALPIPIADFTPSTTAGYVPMQVLFTNNSSYANNYVWDFGNGLDTVTTNNGSTFTLYSIAPQDYVVYMIASNGYCSDTVSKIVKALLPPDISVPNVFSPNDDQSNDIFFVTSQNLASLELLIFNRWGNLMATINSPLGGWDGKTIGGNEATEGVYFYKYVATGLAGEEITGQGFLTLVR